MFLLISHIYCEVAPARCVSLTCLVCALHPLSGEYALTEYTEVKAVTIKLSETL